MHGANPCIVAAFQDSLAQLVGGMGAPTNQPIRPKESASRRRRQIVLTQVNTVGLHGQRQIQAIIHEEEGAMAPAELAKLAGSYMTMPIGIL
jgi:hypothetical protein